MLTLPRTYLHGDEMPERFGRLIRFDEKSREYPVTTMPAREIPLRNFTWRPGRQLDQIGGSCTFFTKGTEMLANPAPVPDELVTNQLLLHGYHLAQHKDPWEGCYLGPSCPIAPSRSIYDGSSVLAALKVAVEWGIAKNYYWAFNTPMALYGIGHRGPAMTGSWWWEGMLNPDPDGRIRPHGYKVGGHETLWNRVEIVLKNKGGARNWDNLDLDQSRVFNRNTWGDWGPAWMTVRDFSTLQYEDGEVAFFVNRRGKPKLAKIA